MTTPITLASLKEALAQPFAPETIQFLPKDIHQDQGCTMCLALPYANKRVYEDRLNELVYGEWSSPYTPPFSQGNKLIIAATVVILGVAHTDYGEAFVTTTSKNGAIREDENTATEAYSQAFRRACAKFGLGRYLYTLPKLTLPYNAKTRMIAASTAERIAWVEKLYLAAHLPVRGAVLASQPVVSALQEPAVPTAQPSASSGKSGVATAQSASTSSRVSQSALTTQKHASTSGTSQKSPRTSPPTSYPHDTFLDWVAQQVERNTTRIQDICDFYRVAGLAQLSATQREELTLRLQRQAQKAQPTSSLQPTHRED